jgi:putative transposase
MSAGPGQPADERGSPGSALSFKLQLRLDLAGPGVRGLRHRRVPRRIVGWRVSSFMRMDFVLVALEQTLHDRQPGREDALIEFTISTVQADTSACATQSAWLRSGHGALCRQQDSYDDALAETINGLYKAGLIHGRALWKTKELAELANLERVA